MTTGPDTVPPALPGPSENSHLENVVARLSATYRSVGEMVYEMIRTAILEGALAPGERLRQEALAISMGVSRIPVRSALIQLESEGLVTFHPRRGAVVRSLTADQLREIYELRELLEPYALARSMRAMTDERLTRLRELATQLDQAEHGPELVELRVAFYRELYDAADNPQTTKIVEELRSAVGRYLLSWRIPGDKHGSHVELVDVVESGDIEKAQALLLKHLSWVREGVQSIAKTDGGASENVGKKGL